MPFQDVMSFLYLTQPCLQLLYSGHKRQDFTAGEEWLPADGATVSMNETFRASGHHTNFSFSKGLKSALPIKTRAYQIITNTSAAMILSFIVALSTPTASFLAHNFPRTLSFLAISYRSLHVGRACEKLLKGRLQQLPLLKSQAKFPYKRKGAIAMPKKFLNLFVAIESLWRGSVTRNEKKQPIDSQNLNVIPREFSGSVAGKKVVGL